MLTTAWIMTGIVGLLSIQPVLNILSPGQVMNTSFDPLDLVNTYGAFGSVGKERYNVVFEGTQDDTTNSNAVWKPYIYKGLPVNPDQRPPQIAPYQLRLDWQMWFAAMSVPDQYPWTYHLVWKMLHNDAGTLGLFAANPFPGKPPRYIRATLYRYRFAHQDDKRQLYWTRDRIGSWLPVLSKDNAQFVSFLRYQHWLK